MAITIRNAREGNLQGITVQIPRNKLTVLTGVSGSGKTTLAVNVLFQECQRQYLEALGMQGIKKPDVERVSGVSPAIMISQTDANRNTRSTVGTLTDIYTGLRMVYEKLAQHTCEHCHETIVPADCRESLTKKDGSFTVFIDCNHCGHRMPAITRAHFSFNTRDGACETCQGLGKTLTLDEDRVIDRQKSLKEGAILLYDGSYLTYILSNIEAAFTHYGMSDTLDTPMANMQPLALALVLHGADSPEVRELSDIAPPKAVSKGRFEGVFTAIWRRMSEKGGDAKDINDYFTFAQCPDCHGERLNAVSRNLQVGGTRLPELSVMPLDRLSAWCRALGDSLPENHRKLVAPYIGDLDTKLSRLSKVGLGYLSPDRQSVTLSGGEMQRLKLAASLDSDLTGVLYIMDEPTVGLHPKDTEGMIALLTRLRDRGNTVVVIEHDTDVMRQADYILDIGPGAGKHGGHLVGEGTLDALMAQEGSITGQFLQSQPPIVSRSRAYGPPILVQNATLHNLQSVNVSMPTDCIAAVAGLSGSGKSSLVFGCIAEGKHVEGLDQFARVITIEQGAIARMRRSNVATYTDAYSEIRKLFGMQPEAKANGLTARDFSFNTKGGRCENCEGLGTIESNLLFFSSMEVECPICGGKRFSDPVLAVQYNGLSIHDVLSLSVEEAIPVFSGNAKLQRALSLLGEVGLSYLTLGQTIVTLSGGECQRLRLARELMSTSKRTLYLMDEPTRGLHPKDVENFLVLLHRIVDAGNSVIIVEHNTDVLKAADFLLEMGPEGGEAGGKVVFAGKPCELAEAGDTHTARALR